MKTEIEDHVEISKEILRHVISELHKKYPNITMDEDFGFKHHSSSVCVSCRTEKFTINSGALGSLYVYFNLVYFYDDNKYGDLKVSIYYQDAHSDFGLFYRIADPDFMDKIIEFIGPVIKNKINA